MLSLRPEQKEFFQTNPCNRNGQRMVVIFLFNYSKISIKAHINSEIFLYISLKAKRSSYSS